MFRIASKLSSRVSPRALVSLSSKPSPISFRSFNTGLALDKSLAVDDVVRMSEYALRQARSEKSVGSYGMGYLVLKHCLTTELTEGNDPKHENSKGIALLTMSTLFSERGDYDDAIEQLNGVQELSNSYLGIRVAAYEAQAGLHLELEQDDMASAVADKCIELVENEKTEDFEALNVRARAIKGLVELVKGDIKSAEPFFDKALRTKLCDGTAALSYAEFQQTRQNYSMAKEIYQNVLEGATELKERGNVYLGGGNMSMEGLMMQAMCGLGQLESHLGNFRNAEEHLTKAVTKADQIYGEKHPKLGVVLTNMALMYRRKAIEQKSSSLVVQEGLYRKVSEILKFPPPETESEGAAAAKQTVKRNDIVALASGGYAELLSVQENRQSEGEKMKKLSDSLWKNSRMSLDDFLGNTEASICPVVACYFHSKYRSGISSTYNEIGVPCEIPYDEGYIHGFFSQDNVKVGDINVKGQEFCEITREGNFELLALPFDGILGLGFQDVSVGKVTPVWYNMIEQGHISDKVFSLWFNNDPMAEVGGEIVFGGVDKRHFRGDHTYFPISQKGYWQIEVGDILLANNTTGLCEGGCAAIVDSGTSLIAGPTGVVTQINHGIGTEGYVSYECKNIVHNYGNLIWESLISGLNPEILCADIRLCSDNGFQRMNDVIETVVHNESRDGSPLKESLFCSFCNMVVLWMQIQIKQSNVKEKVLKYVDELCEKLPNPVGQSFINCSSVSDMPHITFTFGNKLFPLSPEQYVLRVESDDEDCSPVCYSGFVALDVPSPQGPLWVVGDIFLQAYHTVFDYANLRIGFAEST